MSNLFNALIHPRLCALLPTISRGPLKPRFCTTCGKHQLPPYACPLDRYREAVREDMRLSHERKTLTPLLPYLGGSDAP